MAPADVRVQTAYQLTPELVDSVRDARLVVFIDARVGEMPGEVASEVVVTGQSTGAFTHHVTPASLLDASQELYGVLPVGLLISIVGAEFDYGTELSAHLHKSLPSITDQVQKIIETSANVHLWAENHHA